MTLVAVPTSRQDSVGKESSLIDGRYRECIGNLRTPLRRRPGGPTGPTRPENGRNAEDASRDAAATRQDVARTQLGRRRDAPESAGTPPERPGRRRTQKDAQDAARTPGTPPERHWDAAGTPPGRPERRDARVRWGPSQAPRILPHGATHSGATHHGVTTHATLTTPAVLARAATSLHHAPIFPRSRSSTKSTPPRFRRPRILRRAPGGGAAPASPRPRASRSPGATAPGRRSSRWS